MPHEVVQVTPIGGTSLLLTFRSGERRQVDVAAIVPFDGVFAPLADEAFFRSVSINPDIGTIVWPNGADLCPDVLYAQGRATQAA
jgi:hypothetical protein